MSIQTWLDAPIPRKRALGAVIWVPSITAWMFYKDWRAAKIIKDQQQRLHIFAESVDLLLDHADIETVKEIREKLEFWAVVREMPRPDFTEDSEED